MTECMPICSAPLMKKKKKDDAEAQTYFIEQFPGSVGQVIGPSVRIMKLDYENDGDSIGVS